MVLSLFCANFEKYWNIIFFHGIYLIFFCCPISDVFVLISFIDIDLCVLGQLVFTSFEKQLQNQFILLFCRHLLYLNFNEFGFLDVSLESIWVLQVYFKSHSEIYIYLKKKDSSHVEINNYAKALYFVLLLHPVIQCPTYIISYFRKVNLP